MVLKLYKVKIFLIFKKETYLNHFNTIKQMKNLLIILILLSIPLAYAATIHGTVYDLTLDPVKNVLVEIDTHPPQKLVSKGGTYQFSLTKGTYTIKAETLSGTNQTAEENIELTENTGDFILDLFLLPEETGIKQEKISVLWYIIPLLIIILNIFYFIIKRKNTQLKPAEEERSDLDKLIKIIKDNGGRITQKELRKHFPISEAKVSLMITELEAKGKLGKIKKGRSNVLILK